jgi:hypothetical protein
VCRPTTTSRQFDVDLAGVQALDLVAGDGDRAN